MNQNLKPGDKIAIWNGDQSEFLGIGEYVGTATVYAWIYQGVLQSNRNAENPPPDHIPKKDVMSIVDNPKFKLDRRFIYGCQCWWQPVTDEQIKQIKTMQKKAKTAELPKTAGRHKKALAEKN
jgi:hypothetical protein